MSKIRFRQKQLILAASIGGAVILLLCLIIGYLIINHLQGKYVEHTKKIEQELVDTQKKLNEDKTTVTVLNASLKSGDLISENDVTTVSAPISAVPENAADSEEIIGKRVKVDLQKNSIITMPMLFEDGITPNDLRNQELSLVELPIKLQKGDFVDVRIKFPTGQDYIVLSKKKVEDLNNGTVWYKIDEKEILVLSSAIVDAYINDASIYALSYVDPYMQTEAFTTYPSNKDILDLIEENPNIVEVAKTELERISRAKLEQKLKAMSEEDKQSYINGRNTTKMNANNNATSDEEETSVQTNPLINEETSTDSKSSNGNSSNNDNSTVDNFKDSNISVPIQ